MKKVKRAKGFETVTLSELRLRLGELADRVNYCGEEFIITSHGKAVAVLTRTASSEVLK